MLLPSAPCPVPVLLDRIRNAGGSVTTNGRVLRVRVLHGQLPDALLGELQLRQREVYAYLMGGRLESPLF